MSVVARRIFGQTTKNLPIILIGTGLIATILWTGSIMAIALERAWLVVSGMM